jgi:proline dehydrogenase
MLDHAAKGFFHIMARSSMLQHAAARYGMRRPGSFARRFIAGETIEEAIQAARELESSSLHLTLDYLGESVSNLSEAEAATAEYCRIITAIIASGIERNLSLKLTQLGLDVDKASCVDNLRRLLEKAEPAGFFIRLDMEGSKYTEITLEIFETLWGLGHRRIGVVLQAALYRTEEDLPRVLRLGAPVRLVKGAYKEPKVIAYPHKSEVDDAYARHMKILIVSGQYPAFATHDPQMHALALQFAAEQGVGPDRYEFQLLYGIRRDLQQVLVTNGSRVRLYIPFGREWFPYFMRRLGERPANVRSVISSLMDERAARIRNQEPRTKD